MHRDNEEIVEEAKETFRQSLEKAKTYDLVYPPKDKISASQLTASETKDPSCHFFVQKISNEMKRELATSYMDKLFDKAVARMEGVNLRLLLAMFNVDIVRNRAKLVNRPENKAEVRLIIGDPLVRLFREFNRHFKV